MACSILSTSDIIVCERSDKSCFEKYASGRSARFSAIPFLKLADSLYVALYRLTYSFESRIYISTKVSTPITMYCMVLYAFPMTS